MGGRLSRLNRLVPLLLFCDRKILPTTEASGATSLKLTMAYPSLWLVRLTAMGYQLLEASTATLWMMDPLQHSPGLLILTATAWSPLYCQSLQSTPTLFHHTHNNKSTSPTSNNPEDSTGMTLYSHGFRTT